MVLFNRFLKLAFTKSDAEDSDCAYIKTETPKNDLSKETTRYFYNNKF